MQHFRGGLGRGLDALIPRGGSGIQEIEVGRISPNPLQPRQRFDQESLVELAASIREHGILQPVIVTRDGAGYTLIAGERRWRAARLAGFATIPALVKDASPESSLGIALVENLQRADLSPLEEAAAYHELVETFHLTQEQVAARVSRSRVAVANRLRLLTLPGHTKALLADGAISEGHARALLGCADPRDLDALADRIVAEGLSVRETEELVRRARGDDDPTHEETQPRAVRGDRSQQSSDLEEALQRVLGTKVQIVRSRRGGRLVLHYYDDDQLTGIVELLLERGRI
ncbi:MAG TPA: ParB/RepB/Spo0J family partition protein [Chloroflexota bacterium]|nr:ParB/RepB/Spo0J family partition protein [Chloroflexota bacterium]